MSRRGGKRRQVLQLGDSSKLHRYGYSKGFQTMESTVESNALSALVGDYSDSDSEDSDSSDHQKAVNQIQDKEDESRQNTPPPPAVPEPSTNGQVGGKEDPMDDELRNFLSEIEAIPMPDNSKTPDNLSEGVPSPAPIVEAVAQEIAQGDSTVEDMDSSSNKIAATGGNKKKSAYSMFVKGDVEFAHSPTPEQAVEDCQEKAKAVGDSTTDINNIDIPEEPTTRWQMVQDENTQYYYYWNWQTNEVTWEIPSDYTQYLLLHKEYQEKIAKIPPHVLQAWKDKKSGKDKETHDNNCNENAKATSSVGAASTTSAKSQPERKEEVEDERHSYHHHKKKKSKKHKRRRNSSSDDDLDDKYLRDDSTSVKSSSKSKKSKPTIGPQPLSIVPYMSDDNDEDSCNDSNEEEKKPTKEVATNSVSVSETKNKESKSQSNSPTPLSKPKDLEDMEADFDSLVQNLVEFHDNITQAGKRGEGDDTENGKGEAESITKEAVVVNSEVGSERREEVLKKDVDVDEKIVESEGVDVIKKEIELVNDSKVPDEKGNEISSKDKERQNIFDQFSVIKESEKSKRKKKVINMFAEDSQSEMDENVDEGSAKEVSRVDVKLEVEEGEISENSEALKRNIVDSKGMHYEKGRKVHLDSVSKEKVQSLEKQVSSLKSIVGYGEDGEKEEGELKEGEVTQVEKVVVKETADGVASQPKKKVLQYKDYMKKYRSDKSTSNSNNSTVTSQKESDQSHQEKDVQEEKVAQIENVVSQPAVVSQVEENVQKEEGEEDKKLEADGDDNEEEDDSEEDIDFDDLDNIDRVLEKALEKKREHKTENKPETDEKTNDVPESSNVSPSSSSAVETKKTEVVETETLDVVESSAVDSSGMSDTDMKRLKYAVKDSAELALNKLQFLDISTKNLSKLQILLVELQTRYSDWQSGGLSTPYFHKQLKSSEALLSQYEESAVPSGWLCQWDRASCRYFYRNEHNGHTQWEYPQVVKGAEPSSTTVSSKSGEVKDSSSSRGRSSKKRRSKDVEERAEESSKTRGHNSSSRSSRSHRSSKKTSEKDRGKRDRHSSSSHHHRKKKRRRRDHNSSSSSSSEDESGHSSRHRHRSKRKKRGKSDKSPSLEVIDCDEPDDTVQVIEDSPPPSVVPDEIVNDGGDGSTASPRPVSATLGLIADYGSEQEMDDDEEDVDEGRSRNRADGNDVNGDDGDVRALERRKREMEEELEGIDGEVMEKEEEGADGLQEQDEGGKEEEEPAEEEDMNGAVIVKPPQIIVPPYVAAMNQPQLYSAPALYTSVPMPSSATAMAPPVCADQEQEQGETTTSSTRTSTSQASEENDKAGGKKKKKDKSGKEKSLTSNSSIMMKKKRVSTMVQKWQQVKKEVEKENRDKELRQAAIREKINQLKST